MLFKDLKDPGFCESLIWTPEYVNAITSFAMLYFSVLGLFLNKTRNYLIITIFSNIFVNFIGSFAFHYTLYQGWGLIDTITMVIAGFFGMYTIWTTILQFFIIGNVLHYISIVFFMLTNVFMAFSLADRALDNFIGFETAIAVPFILIIIGTVVEIIIAKCKGVETKERVEYVDFTVIKYLIAGVVMVFLTSLIWLLTEPFCYTKDNRIAYTFSHAFWHIFVSYGFYLIAVCNIYLHGFLRKGRSALVYRFDNDGFFFLFPRCTFTINKNLLT